MPETTGKVTRVKSLRSFAVVAKLVVTLSFLLTGNAASQGLVNSDPHVPPFVNIDGGDYLRLRAEHIGLLRGLPHPDPSARIRAVQEMNRQMERQMERELAAGTPSAAASVSIRNRLANRTVSAGRSSKRAAAQ
jgi:hypothetical protein